MDIFFETLLVGAAVAYILEAVLATNLLSPALVKGLFPLPLAVFGLWLFSITGFHLFICSPAASFVTLALMKLVNKPTVVQTTRRNY